MKRTSVSWLLTMKILLTSLFLVGAEARSDISAVDVPQGMTVTQPLDIISRPVRIGFATRTRRDIDTIVIHTSYNPLGGDVYGVDNLLAIFHDYGVSSHYLIDREGRVYQLVADKDMSYHAGISRMPDGRTSVNQFSIGIELLNTPEDACTEAEYESLRKLIALLKIRYPINNIVGHGQIAPQRRNDPLNFDWTRLQNP